MTPDKRPKHPTREVSMYPSVIQFETRQIELERRLQQHLLIKEAKERRPATPARARVDRAARMTRFLRARPTPTA
jgi:hypothetical protein